MRFAIAAFLSVAVIAFGISGLTGCSSQTGASVAEIKLPTIQCDTCVKTVSKALKQVDGVKAVDVNLEKKLVTVTYVPGKTTVAGLEQAVVKAGYGANTAVADPKAYASLPKCCKLPEDQK